MNRPALAAAVLLVRCAAAASSSSIASAAPRIVRADGRRFVLTATGEPIVMQGPNVVVKGPPYLPAVEGDAPCKADYTGAVCQAARPNNCTTCSTFNAADIVLMKSVGYNAIRLGVVWAGAQPRDEDALDPVFLRRLHALLNLTDAANIAVMLDNHGDMTGTAGCGNGAPMWFQKKAAPQLIGKPLVTGFPYSLIPEISVSHTGGYDHCRDDATKWAAHAGDANYNLLNECCLAMNSGNPGGLGYTTVQQKTMDHMLSPGPGRDDFVRFWRLIAEAVVHHPSAFAAELSNEPMSIKRDIMYDTWRACAEAINEVVPDMSVSLSDTGQEPFLPAWVDKLGLGGLDIGAATLKWIKDSKTVFYAFHGYNLKPSQLVARVTDISEEWNVPTFVTEGSGGCDKWNAFRLANISRLFWHYSAYCDTGSTFGNRAVPADTFGGCMLGWGSGDPTKYTDKKCAQF